MKPLLQVKGGPGQSWLPVGVPKLGLESEGTSGAAPTHVLGDVEEEERQLRAGLELSLAQFSQ